MEQIQLGGENELWKIRREREREREREIDCERKKINITNRRRVLYLPLKKYLKFIIIIFQSCYVTYIIS
jgi:hypothetical protein